MAGNQITELLDPAQMPNQDQDQQTFDNLWAGVLRALPNWGAQANTLAASLNALAAGGAYAIPYTFDTATADADPGSGKLRLDNVTQTSATTIRLDLISNGIGDVTSIVDRFDASTSIIKGAIRLVKQGDVTKWLTFDITARAAPTGYRNITLTNAAGSSTSPFVNGDALTLLFQRNGDKGDTGAVASFPVFYAREEQTAGTSSTTPSTFGTVTCVLNTVKVNEISGVSLSGNQFTLPAGTYEYEASTVAYGSTLGHKGQLYNVTDAVITDTGWGDLTNATDSRVSRSYLRGKLTISAAKAFQLRRYTSGNSSGNPVPVGAGSGTEVYSEIQFKKVA